MSDLFDLEGRVAIVTGASSGLGRRFAATLAAAGATVVACARRADLLEQLASEHQRIEPLRVDVGDAADRRALIAHALTNHGRIDVCVNNAGVASGHPRDQLDPDTFERVLAINVTALFALSALAAEPMLAAGRGSIVNVSSIFGQVAASPVSDAGYVTSKAAINGLTRELAAQWAPRGVRVNAIAPGWIPTEMNAGLFADEKAARWIERNTPIGRPGTPADLDGALIFLASDASAYCTGHVLVVDGGWTLR